MGTPVVARKINGVFRLHTSKMKNQSLAPPAVFRLPGHTSRSSVIKANLRTNLDVSNPVLSINVFSVYLVFTLCAAFLSFSRSCGTR